MCSRRILFQEILPTRVQAHLARFLIVATIVLDSAILADQELVTT